MTDDILSPDKLQAALERLERERARRRAGKPPEAPTAVARHVVDPSDNVIINRPASPAPRQAKPKPRKAAKPARLTPTPFFVVLANALGADPGRIEAGHYVTKGKELALSDAAGDPTSDWRPIGGHGALWTARQALRDRLAARRGSGPDHRPIAYDNRGWR